MRNILVIVGLLLCFHIQYILAQNNNITSRYIFDALSIDKGLPSNFVDDIYKDSHGFIWVSTQGGGLSRYDGYEFLSLNVNSLPISIKSNFIRKVCEDNFHRLWIFSNNGIDVIDLQKIQKYEFANNENKKYLLNIQANTALKDKEGSLWLLSTKTIYKLSFDEKGNITSIIESAPSTSGQYSFSTISEIDGEIWAGNGNSIYRIVENNGQLLLKLEKDISDLVPHIYIAAILKKDNIVWIGADNGLYQYDLLSGNLRHYIHKLDDRFSLSQDMVTDLSLTHDGILVAGTLKGLNFYDPVMDRFDRVSHQNNINTLNNDFINCILSDGNTLWIGTEAGGVNSMNLHRLNIQNYTHEPNNRNTLSPNPVNAILEDNKGSLWVGTVEGGLNRKRKGENFFSHFTAAESGLSHNSVSTLEEDNNENLWIGTWGGGISILNINSLKQFSFRNITLSGLDYIGILKYDSTNHGMWIGTNRNIFFYDIQTESLKNPLPDKLTQNIMGTLGYMVDNDNKIWMGTSDGLIIADLEKFDKTTFECPASFLEIEDNDLSRLFLKNVTFIYQAKDNSIWIGSNGYGICNLKREGDRYASKSFSTEQGLSNNTVFAVLEDENGTIWVSTGRGISCYDPMTNRFTNYTKNDGLISDQFYWNAGYKSPSTNNLYFGSMGGLTELRGVNQYSQAEKRKATFTQLQILNKAVWYNGKDFIEKDIAYTNRLDLHERDKSFSVEFSALNYENPSTIIYSYRLLGFDDKWIDVPADRRFASYTNLRPGNYKLQVRSIQRGADWSDDMAELEIVVHPFFYKTVWFIGLMIMLLAALTIQFYRWRVNSFKKQREILHRKVEERTSELESQKELLEEQAMELKLQNNVLITQNEKITFQRKQLLDMSQKVQEAMDDRMSFFTNITHEFRTPITLIIGPIDRALKLSTNPKVIEQLQYVSRNSKHLLSLVNQLMDFRKVESDNMKINLSNGNFQSFLDEILIPFESFARERNIIINKVYRLRSPYLMFDEEAMRKLITNLLSNAIKFTPDNGTVTVYAGIIKDINTHKDKLYLCVRDSGIGIKNEDINRIFNRFYQSKGSDKFPVYGQSGTGIGLYLCKNIVQLLNGKIEARNNHTKGASMRVVVPLLHNDKSKSGTFENVSTEKGDDIDISKNSVFVQLGQKLTVLVVEDNYDMRKYISSILSDYYKIEEAENGKEALDILKSKSIDFIISDLMMPVMDGLELSQKVKADFSISHIPFLMLTAKTSLETQISSYKIGVDEFLAKPFDEELLLTRISNILETRKNYQRKFSFKMDAEELNIVEESADERFLRKALEVVKTNYQNTEYEVSDFINDMGVSKSLLNKKMQMLTGQSAGNFIRNYRLTIAHELILKTKGNMNISEIAYEVGFNDPKYFTRCFTKHFGMAPSMLNKEDK